MVIFASTHIIFWLKYVENARVFATWQFGAPDHGAGLHDMIDSIAFVGLCETRHLMEHRMRTLRLELCCYANAQNAIVTSLGLNIYCGAKQYINELSLKWKLNCL